MARIFETVLNVSISSLWLIFAVLCARLAIYKAPKWTRMILWGLVAVRLAMPFALESPFSLVPETEVIDLSADHEKNENNAYERPVLQTPEKNEGIGTGVTPSQGTLQPVTPIAPDKPEGHLPIAPTEKEKPTPIVRDEEEAPVLTEEETGTENTVKLGSVLSVVWVIGVALMMWYFVFSYLRLRFRLKDAVHSSGRLWYSDRIDNAFVYGIIKPRIYMPFRMNESNAAYVLAHEQAHIRRGDHIIKPLAFFILALHWFNPAVWCAYILFCKDAELACDERVIRGLDNEKKKAYSHALVSLSAKNHRFSVYPLSFGEVGIKSRLKNIFNYKKPTMWVVILAVVLCAVVAVCFMTVRGDEKTDTPVGATEGTDETNALEPPTEASTEPSTEAPTEPPTEPPHTEHEYSESARVEASCLEDGEITFVCTYCGETKNEVIPAMGHNATAADCTTDGSCTRCGVVLEKAYGHNMSEATCTAPSACANCGMTEGEALRHTYGGIVLDSGIAKDIAISCIYCGAQPYKLPIGEPFDIYGEDDKGDIHYRVTVSETRYNKYDIYPSDEFYFVDLDVTIENLSSVAREGNEVFYKVHVPENEGAPGAYGAFSWWKENKYVLLNPGEKRTITIEVKGPFHAEGEYILDIYLGPYDTKIGRYITYYLSEGETIDDWADPLQYVFRGEFTLYDKDPNA